MEKTGTTTGTKKGKADHSMLENFFLEELRDIYGAEKLLVKSLPKLEKAASSDDLATAFENHVDLTENHVIRLERIFEMLGEKPQSKKCEGMEGLIKEGKSVIASTANGSSTRDVGLIVSAQKVEHYEIAAYGGLAQLAKTLGKPDIAKILGETLKEAKDTDMSLTKIAETHINQEAHEEVET